MLGLILDKLVLKYGCDFNLKIVKKNFKITGENFQNIFDHGREHKPLKALRK
jgi:hypothetical protein